MQRLFKGNTVEPNQTLIALLRHGKTLWNEEGRIQGRQDSPLSSKGSKQVHDWGRFIGNYAIDHIVASDLGRVRETVAIIQQYCNSVPVEWKQSLREQAWGEWEGKSFRELKNQQPEELATQIRAGWDFRPPGGESRKEVLQRALPVIKDIPRKYPGKRILVISHEGIVKSIIYHLAGRAFLPEEEKLLQKRQLHLLLGGWDSLQLGPLNILPTPDKAENQ
ncbi:fructose-2,6-bisphosphatase [Desulfocapsa sulfexigens DSM 10523]|uniref:phosphoglycerate mutase (2,3-diphosphoglycerate-dependent) n=1 Tax=Desulfocapsa sulfexigens (strain DSM 10523 / SB164P1) TaxID=1167006 RepID=M1P4N2_DESSD|nr:histidine phosphatase family protein [Desulfocapsa sulfexigens]AGF78433.1 fructose-2,6-bisphosphatase [Desulfocapsa sulfexigens DSM 10523]